VIASCSGGSRNGVVAGQLRLVVFGLVGVNISYIGGPRDGESSSLVSGEPPAVLVVDDSGGRYVWREGRYWCEAG